MRKHINHLNKIPRTSGVNLWVAIIALFSFVFVGFANTSAALASDFQVTHNHIQNDYILGDITTPTDDGGESNDGGNEETDDSSFEEVAKYRSAFSVFLPSINSVTANYDEFRSWLSSEDIYILQPGGL